MLELLKGTDEVKWMATNQHPYSRILTLSGVFTILVPGAGKKRLQANAALSGLGHSSKRIDNATNRKTVNEIEFLQSITNKDSFIFGVRESNPLFPPSSIGTLK